MMPVATQAPSERVNAFPIDNVVLFKHYFEGEAVFNRLRPYYNGTEYRFEVPCADFDALRRFLLDHGYELSIVDQPKSFYIVVRQYSEHPDGIFKQSVRHEQVDDYHVFLMTDRSAVEEMVANGAERLTSKPLVVQSGTLADFHPLSA